MSFPKKGKFLPGNGSAGGREPPPDVNFATAIAAALHRSLGPTHAAIKTAAVWTGANERTAKNWFSGRYSPSSEHLVALAQNSDEVLSTFLIFAGRTDLIAAVKLVHAEQAVLDVLLAIRSLNTRSN